MNRRSSDAQNYLDMLASNSLCPIITQPTRVADTSSIIIDHFITNCTSHSILPGIIKSDLTDHYPVFCSINHLIKIKPSNKYFYRFMKNFNSETFVSDLSNNLDHFDFSALFSDIRELSAAFDKFIEIIKSTINAHPPLKIASRKQRKLLSKPWLTKGIQISIRNKKKLHQSFYVGGNVEQKLYYKKYANKLTKVKKLSKKLHFFKEFETMSNNNHELWKTINNLLPSKLSNSSAPKVIKVGNVKVDNPTDIANHFNEFFYKIRQSFADKVNRAGNENSIKYLNNRINESVFLTPINFQEISRINSSLASDVVSFLLSIFFNLFIEQGCFPEPLKLSKVISIFKSDAKCDLSHYCPISLLSVISKVFEKLISIRVMSFIEKHSILSPTQ